METIVIKNGKIKIDMLADIDFEKDYVHAPDTSLFKGFAFGKISKQNAQKAKDDAGFNFYKIVAASKSLNIDGVDVIED